MTFTYFAYGSNMLSSRLIVRCKSAKIIGLAHAPGYFLEFTKRSVDNSGKATLTKTNATIKTPGVLFKIDESEREALDKFEGAGNGYDRVDDFRVNSGGSVIIATTYLASERQEYLSPYDWYLALVVAGAKEHSLCNSHVDRIRAFEYDTDQKQDRKTRTAAIQALELEGYHDFLSLLSDRRHSDL